MHCYSPTSPQNISNGNEVDERWDSNLGFFSHDQSFKDHQLESRFQNINISREISPPLTSTKKGINELTSGCFKEDIEQDNYFQPFKSPVIVITTPPVECDYLTTQDAIHDNTKPPRKRNMNDEQDFSIMSVNELSPIESLQFQNQDQQEHTTPVSLVAYRSDLVQHYTKSALQMANPDIKMDTLPKAYKTYLDNIRNSCHVYLPNSL